MKYVAIIGSLLMYYVSCHCAFAAFNYSQYALVYGSIAVLGFCVASVVLYIGAILFIVPEEYPDYEDGQLDIDAGHKRFIVGGKK